MEGQSVRSRTTSHSPSPSSHSVSASVSSSLHKRKLDDHLPSTFPYSYSDTTKDDEIESISARRGDSEFENDSEDVVVEDDDPDADIGDEEEEEDNDDSMRVFTNARLENNSRKTKIKMENSLLKIDSDIQKLTASNVSAPIVGSGIGVKEILTENLQASGAYSAREESLKREEESGRLKFVCYGNDGVDQHMIWLIGLKNIFARQLPNMPKEYIVRLVMDRSHKSVMVIRHNHVVGGITFRPYVSQKFGEIAFLAITSDEQVKGYGTRLMNHLKQHARDVDGLTHFLTYADNNAVGYFIKQGFTKEINLEKDRWQGYIKEYDGGILMECRIDPKLPYTDLSTMIRQQRQAIDEKIRELSNCHIVYPGIDFQKKEAGIPKKIVKVEDIPGLTGIPKKIVKVEDIPGLREAGWTPDQWGHSQYKTLNPSADSTDFRQSLITFMRTLLKMMHDHPDAWPFKEPVDSRDVPDYYDVIKDPMDLRTMSKRLESEQYYLTLEMFVADTKRMLANARTYNSPETIYYKCSTRLENFFFMKVQAGLQACSKGQQ